MEYIVGQSKYTLSQFQLGQLGRRSVMAGEKDQGKGRAPIIEEVTLESAQRILNAEGFHRVIQISRDPRSGKIIDLVLREVA
jgi:hypothetical protein